MAVLTAGIPPVPSLEVFSLRTLSECLLRKSVVSRRMDELDAHDGPVCAQGQESHAFSILRLVVLGLGRSQQMQLPSWRVILRKFMLYGLQPSQLTCFALGTVCRFVVSYLFR